MPKHPEEQRPDAIDRMVLWLLFVSVLLFVVVAWSRV